MEEKIRRSSSTDDNEEDRDLSVFLFFSWIKYIGVYVQVLQENAEKGNTGSDRDSDTSKTHRALSVLKEALQSVTQCSLFKDLSDPTRYHTPTSRYDDVSGLRDIIYNLFRLLESMLKEGHTADEIEKQLHMVTERLRHYKQFQQRMDARESDTDVRLHAMTPLASEKRTSGDDSNTSSEPVPGPTTLDLEERDSSFLPISTAGTEPSNFRDILLQWVSEHYSEWKSQEDGSSPSQKNLRSEWHSLVSELQSVSPDQIVILTDEPGSILNRMKGCLEAHTHEAWDWWPLKPYRRPLDRDEVRLQWTCVGLLHEKILVICQLTDVSSHAVIYGGQKFLWPSRISSHKQHQSSLHLANRCSCRPFPSLRLANQQTVVNLSELRPVHRRKRRHPQTFSQQLWLNTPAPLTCMHSWSLKHHRFLQDLTESLKPPSGRASIKVSLL
jgi:hypothetical protein